MLFARRLRPAKEFSPHMKRRLNHKLFLILCACLTLVGVVVHWVHALQVRSNVGALLRQADWSLQKGDYGRAIGFLEKYLTSVPEDVDTLAKLGLTLDEHATSFQGRFQAYLILHKV